MSSALYAFSGDPITYGHIDIIRRASKVFDKLIVGIGSNPDKKYLFPKDERKDMAEKSLSHIPNVSVFAFQGTLMDFAYEQKIKTLVKGVRNFHDFEYENILRLTGESVKLGIDTCIFFADPKLAHISSSVVKALQKEQGFIYEYVPLSVKQKLEKKISRQFIVAVTGEIASGKTYACKKFAAFGKKKKIPVHHIDLDEIVHDILAKLSDPQYEKIRRDLKASFGENIQKKDGFIDRKKLGEIVFQKKKDLEKLNRILRTPILVRLRRKLYGKKGIILLDAALLAEAKMNFLSNNTAMLVKIDKKTQKIRLKKRGLSEAQIRRRIESQYRFDIKKKFFEEKIKKDRCGKIWICDGENENNYQKIFKKIFEKYQA